VLWLLVALGFDTHAADLVLEVGGSPAPQSLVAMALGGGDVELVACADDGAGADRAVDGLWTCGPLDVETGEVSVALAWDGRLLDVGAVVMSGDGLRLQVKQAGNGVLVDPGTELLTPRKGARASRSAPLVLALVSGTGDGGAPVMRLKGSGGQVQGSCSDDGNFPDSTRNDGIVSCVAPALGDSVLVSLQGAGSEAQAFGAHAVERGAVAVALEIDVQTGSAASTALSWPWPAAAPETQEPAPGPDPTPPEPGPEPEPGPDPVPPDPAPGPEPAPGPDPVPPDPMVGPQHTDRPQAPQPVVDRAAPGAHGGAAATSGRGLIDLLAVLFALACGFGLAWVVRPKGPRLPSGVSRVDAPPLFDAGPRRSDGATVFQTAEPGLFLVSLLRRVAAEGPVLVVLPEGSELPELAGGPVYRSAQQDWEEVERQVRGLQRAGGVSPSVVVLGRDTLQAPGAVADDPAARLAETLPSGGWLGVVCGLDDPTVGLLRPWVATRDGDGWQLEQT